ncbi:lipase, putative [Bodo saltans]|uniref:Lipase, putative n=1 Tax=Bodo saltans TaxID=75058 RepID=A0A0S4JR03_BODSA|nr:lipase, putative [Bodo saltans]|eukprot:CUG92755.1 lipase, putative [Bodo saltans]
MVAAVKGEYDLQPQLTTTGNYNHDEDTAGNVTWIGALSALPMLGIAWYYHQRTLFARYPKGVADMSSPASFGVPSHRHNTRPFVIAARYLMPFCIAATFFLSYAYILTYMHLSYLLPSYNNGHLVEVLLTGLLGWTVAVALVPVRKSLATHPPRPCIYPPKWSTSFDPAVPLWCQLPWRSAYDQGIASGVLPNCGYAFLTEEHEAMFHRAQREFRIEQLIGEYNAGVQKRHEQHPSAIVPPSRSFFCWETAVRCVNISNETYNDLEGDVDLVEFTRNETYEPDEFEACVVQNCCCCVTTMLMSGGGCAGEREEDDVLPTEAAAAATFTTTPTVPLVVLSQHHQFDYERTPYVMGPSKRRFGEAGAVAVDPSGGSARKQRSHRRTHHHGTVPNDRDEDDALNGSPRKTSAPHVVVVSFEEPSADHSYHPLSSSTSPTKTPKKNINTAAASPSRRLAAKRPPPILVVEATLQATSHKSEPPMCCVNTTSENLPGPSPAEEVLATTHNSASSSSAVPLALVNLVAPKGQINVSRYGYQLIKVLDVFGVRVLIAATPPNTSGRHPHLSIAFRGTVNIRNALTNVNARTLEHPEMKQSLSATNTDGEGGATKESSSSGEAAEVHSGFWGAFQQILPTLASALHEFYFPASINATIAQKDLTGVSCPVPSEWAQQLTHVVVMGHSLGGVLAMLCAYSIARGTLYQEVFSKLQVRPELRCYTFGSPRLGNAYLSNVYASAVPETYRVINENDVISHVGLCWHEYNGREVRINRDGDAVIEGTYLETCFASSLTQGVGSRFKNHLLDRYGNSFDNCLCSRNLRMLSPECCSFMMVHVDQENNYDDDDSSDDASSAASDVCDTPQ